LRHSDSEDEQNHDAPVQTYDGRAVLQYSRPGQKEEVDQRLHSDSAVFRRRQNSWHVQHQQRARLPPVRRRSRSVEVVQQRGFRHTVEGARHHSGELQQRQRRREQLVLDKPGKVKQPFVSFYFTNIPENISYISLRRGFEVCGILEDVYLARKRNANGGVFGFVRYGNVKDVDKLLQALNNVWFGDWRVVAKVASFDRLGNKNHGVGVSGVGVSKNAIGVGGEGIGRHAGRDINIKEVNRNVRVSDVVAEAAGCGEVVFKPVEGNNVKVRDGAVEHARVGTQAQRAEVGLNRVYIPKYTSSASDMSWASKGVVVTVLGRDVIPVLQRRIFDAGFVNLAITPLGADKVFLRSLDEVDVSTTLSEAADFFANFFSSPVRWNKDTLVRERVAWLRIYGVPLHAWNYDFFKLCVYDFGRLLRIDDITLDKDRFDYARVLVSTSSLDIIKRDASIVVDGVLLGFQIIEEWGLSLGEDACLLEDDPSQVDDRSELPEDLDTGFVDGDVDELLNGLSEDWKIEDDAHHIKSSSSTRVSEKVQTSNTPAPAVVVPVETPPVVPAANPTQARVFENECKDDCRSREPLRALRGEVEQHHRARGVWSGFTKLRAVVREVPLNLISVYLVLRRVVLRRREVATFDMVLKA